MLGVEPRLGRGFREDEDQVPGRDAVVVLGPDFWRHEFAGDPGVVGTTVRLNGAPFTVIGVAPDSFPGMLTFGHPDFYMPLAMARTFSTNIEKNFFEDRDDRELNVKARLRRGTTLSQARNELSVIAKNFEHDYPDVTRSRGAAVYTQFQTRTTEDDNWKFGVVFVILALAVLLVACTNVAGLLLSRARERAREIAVRLALGAGRLRLIRLLLTESLILAILGGLAGIAIGYGVIEWFHSKDTIIFATELPMAVPFQMDNRVLLLCVGLSVLSAFLCGLAPALQSTRVDLVNALKSADVDVPGRRRLWGRNTAGGGAGFDVADAADRFFLDGARIPARLAGGYRFHERSFADDQFRSTPDAVQRHADAAVLQAAGRAHAGNSRSAERGADAEYSTRNGRV